VSSIAGFGATSLKFLEYIHGRSACGLDNEGSTSVCLSQLLSVVFNSVHSQRRQRQARSDLEELLEKAKVSAVDSSL